MSLNAVKILGINITISSKKEILEEIKKRLNSTEKSRSKAITIVTPNPEQIVYATGDKRFAGILNRADVAIPDGIGVVWAHRILGGATPLVRIPGVELMDDLIGQARKQGVPVALIGGRRDLAVKTLERLQQEYDGLKGVALEFPEVKIEAGELQADRLDSLDENFRRIAGTLEQKRIRMIFVALGAPKQEYVIDRLAKLVARFPYSMVLMSVGGSFDIITGRTPRAPQFLRTFGLEWLWRLAREPWRWKRQGALVKFVWLVLQKRYTTK